MIEIFKKLKDIIDDNSNCNLKGIIVYLLTSEEEPYKLYRLNMSTNEGLKEILSFNLSKVKEDVSFLEYKECTCPDGTEKISYIKEDEIPNYNSLKNKILNDEATTISKKRIEKIKDYIKAYAIKVLYDINNCESGSEVQNSEEEFICFSKLTKSYLFEAKHQMFKFNSGEGDQMEEVNDIFLRFNNKLAFINIEKTVFILQGYYFEQILKYDELIDKAAKDVLSEIKDKNLITNFDILEDSAKHNKNFRKKLYKIKNNGNTNNITIDKFKDLKNSYGDNLLFTLNNNTISIDEEKKNKSIEHVLRICNDEVAQTFLTKTSIFANEKITIK